MADSKHTQHTKDSAKPKPAQDRAARQEQEDAERKAVGLPPKMRSKDDTWREPGEPEVPYLPQDGTQPGAPPQK